MPPVPSGPEQPGFRWLDSETLECVFRGHVTGASMHRVVERTREMIGARRPRVVIFETTEVTSFTADVRIPGVPWLADLKMLGVEVSWAVAPSSAVRMMGASIALAAGLRLHFVAKREEALAAIAQRVRKTG